MKKAKISLLAIALISIFSVNLAFIESGFTQHVFYSYGATTTTVGGPVVTGCVVPVTTALTTTVVGGFTTRLGTTTFLTTNPNSYTSRVTASPNE